MNYRGFSQIPDSGFFPFPTGFMTIYKRFTYEQNAFRAAKKSVLSFCKPRIKRLKLRLASLLLLIAFSNWLQEKINPVNRKV